MDFSKILFLHCLDDRKLYGYLPYAERIDNPIEQVKDFKKNGYVEFSTPEDNLSRITVPELKALLSAHDMPVKGTKPVLLKSVLENIPSSEYADLVEPKTKVFLTDKARELLKGYEYLFWFKSNEQMLFRVSESEVENLAKTTPASEMIAAIEALNSKKSLSQANNDLYNEIRYNKCIVCGSNDAGSYDLCENCEKTDLSDNQIFHISQLFGCLNRVAILDFELDMSRGYSSDFPEMAVQEFKDFCYSFGTPGHIYYKNRKEKADRTEDPTPGSPSYLIKVYG